jgi:hypothetical protein
MDGGSTNEKLSVDISSIRLEPFSQKWRDSILRKLQLAGTGA